MREKSIPPEPLFIKAIRPFYKLFRFCFADFLLPLAYKKEWAKYVYYNGIVKVRWPGKKDYNLYSLSPVEDNKFQNSPQMQLMMRMLAKYPEGVAMNIDGIDYSLRSGYNEPKKMLLPVSFHAGISQW